jgi:hypothetical protein
MPKKGLREEDSQNLIPIWKMSKSKILWRRTKIPLEMILVSSLKKSTYFSVETKTLPNLSKTKDS